MEKIGSVKWLPKNSKCDYCLDESAPVIAQFTSCAPECQLNRCIQCFKNEMSSIPIFTITCIAGTCPKCGERYSSLVQVEIAEQEELAKKKAASAAATKCFQCNNTHKMSLIISECGDVFCEDCFKQYSA